MKNIVPAPLSFLIGLMILPLCVWSQTTFKAVCDAREVLVGSAFEVSFVLKDARIKKLNPPSFNGLSVQGPQTSQSFSYVNGKTSTNESHTYRVTANKPGTYTIGAATVITNNSKSLRSKPIIVKVVKKKANRNAALDDKIFIRTEVNNTEPVVGEQVIVDIRIFKQVRLESANVVFFPDFENSYSKHLSNFVDRPVVVVENGQEYVSQILQRTIVFPTKSGDIIIEPAVLDIGISANSGRNFFDPFRVIEHRVQTDSVRLRVSELDGGAPGFSGAVGQYEFKAHVAKNTIDTDGAVELTLRIAGTGDLKQVEPSGLGKEKRYFDQFDPNINEKINHSSGAFRGVKTFQYVLNPKATGQFELKPYFTYFDIGSRKFVRLDTTITIQVKRGKTALPSRVDFDKGIGVASDIADDTYNSETSVSFAAVQSQATFVPKTRQAFLGNAFFWILLLLPFLGLAAAYYYRQQQVTLQAQPLAQKRKKEALSIASKHLNKAQQALEQQQAGQFYKDLAEALQGFVADKYNIPPVNFTKDQLKATLESKGLAETEIQRLIKVLETCEMALFAGLSDQASMEQLYQESADILEQLSALEA